MDVKPINADLLFEIGVEEMPSAPLNKAHAQLKELSRTSFAGARLGYEDITVFSTPRRLSLLVKGVAERQEDVRLEYKGPAKKIAFAEDGTPSKALEGFARGKGVELSDIEVRNVDGAEYVYAVKDEKGKQAKEVLPELLQGLITGLDWPKRQRWGSGEETFIRPVRWILAILGSSIIPLSFGEVQSSNFTYGHRFLSTQQIPIVAMREYKSVLRGNKVIVDQDKRRAMIMDSIVELAAPHGTALIPEKVIDEVVNLVEFPNALLCSFDEGFLRVPREILEYAMNSHQRYFAIEATDGTLSNHFVVISNGDPLCSQKIAAGHESVIRARLADAAFFYDEDLKAGLDSWKSKLDTLLFQQKLGTLADKTERIIKLVSYLNDTLDVPADTAATALRAAELVKADLTSNTVVEFTELQGVIGAYYAQEQGESDEVALTIEQHYLPRYSGDKLPETLPAQLVSLADKVDTIVGIIAAGFAPKGTSDPYALRRNAIGVLRIIMDALPLDLNELIAASAATMPADLQGSKDEKTELVQKISQFFTSRLDSILRAQADGTGYSTEVVSAVLAAAANKPADAAARASALQNFFTTSDAWENLSTAYTRAKNLSERGVGVAVDTALLNHHEQVFFDALTRAQPRVHAYMVQASEQSYHDYLNELARMRKPLDDFFDNVMVMDDDEALRRNRLALLNILIELIEPFADLRRLSRSK